MNKAYTLQQSKLYRLRNRTKLAELLMLPPSFFKHGYSFVYEEFSKPKPNGSGLRIITAPEENFKKIQKRICRLLSRIKTPEWLISGKRQQSYVTNAERHIMYKYVKTMDITKFYETASRSKIFNLFRNTFMMEPDIAWLVTDLVTYKGHLPTGGPSSQIVAFWAYKDMFTEINEIAQKYSCVFTLYVDDMTFSSNKAIPRELREEVNMALRKNGLRAKSQKDHYYQSKDYKVVTGVGIKNGKKSVLNHHRKGIVDLYRKCIESNSIKDTNRLKGMLCSARQIEPTIFQSVENYIAHVDKKGRKLS